MVQVNFLNKSDLITVPVIRFTTSNSTNSIYLYFESDGNARDNEKMLKENGYKTEHTDCVIRVFNFNSFDVLIPN